MVSINVKVIRIDLARYPVARALGISLLFHLLFFTSLEFGYRMGWWRSSPIRALLQPALTVPTLNSKRDVTQNPSSTTRETPLLFVDVDASHAVEEPPKETKYYSAVSTRAANPDAQIESNTPKIEGQQTRIVKTFDTLRPQPVPTPPQPLTEAKPNSESDSTEAKPKGGVAPGDLAFNKPQVKPRPDDGEAETERSENRKTPPERPRTLAQAKLQKGMIAGEKMQQDGGVKQRFDVSLLDVKGTSFGAYDQAVLYAIQRRWYDLLDDRKFALDRSGKVVLDFHLNSDGRITGLKVAEADVGDFWTIICQKAVEDPAPFAPWPSNMRREIGKNFREVRFTFYYN